MFTGLIQETGSILSVERRGGVHHITVHAPTLASQLRVGDSIAVGGVCLTALATAPEENPDRFEADLAEETVRRTSLSQLAPGAVVNLELPTAAGAPLGGHVVQGHVDGVGCLLSLYPVFPGGGATDWWLEVEIPEIIRPYVVEKGSIAIEGISLTIARWDGQKAAVAIIPHTYAHTNLSSHKPGDLLNLEADVLLRHAIQTGKARESSEELTLSYLLANGY
ncbi:MAG TPA: riboflavin synthase [Acidobacteriaceae bacterium]